MSIFKPYWQSLPSDSEMSLALAAFELGMDIEEMREDVVTGVLPHQPHDGKIMITVADLIEYENKQRGEVA